MEVKIHFIHLATSESLKEYVLKKTESLSKKYDWIINLDVSFKKENDTTGIGKICDIEVSSLGPLLFATSNEKNYESAFKNSLGDIETQLKKRKQQMKPYL